MGSVLYGGSRAWYNKGTRTFFMHLGLFKETSRCKRVSLQDRSYAFYLTIKEGSLEPQGVHPDRLRAGKIFISAQKAILLNSR
jgi:hypothetical protein